MVGHGVKQPLGTVTAVDHHSLVTTSVSKLKGLRKSSKNKSLLVAAFITSYYSKGGTENDASKPLPTVVTKARHGLVMVDINGETYAVTDIRFRMLKPLELARAQGFSDDYILTGTQAEQIGRIGNSVCPDVEAALVRANAIFDDVKTVAL